MKPFFALALAAASTAASAQTPATNPMPDGSRDMYAGLGVVSRPRYEGADNHKVSALPLLQVQWSNGLFISGMSAGMHLSNRPTVEYGPLLTIHPNRDESGSGQIVDGVGINVGPVTAMRAQNRLVGMEDVSTRLEGGAFFNYYLAPEWRLTSSLLYGAGNNRHGARVDLGLQRLALQVGAHHRVSVSAGLSFANADYNAAFFGVDEFDSLRSGKPVYRPGSGLKDGHLGLRWNWDLTPSWMLTTNLQVKRLAGDARRSPLVERPTNTAVSAAFAYRF